MYFLIAFSTFLLFCALVGWACWRTGAAEDRLRGIDR